MARWTDHAIEKGVVAHSEDGTYAGMRAVVDSAFRDKLVPEDVSRDEALLRYGVYIGRLHVRDGSLDT